MRNNTAPGDKLHYSMKTSQAAVNLFRIS